MDLQSPPCLNSQKKKDGSLISEEVSIFEENRVRKVLVRKSIQPKLSNYTLHSHCKITFALLKAAKKNKKGVSLM